MRAAILAAVLLLATALAPVASAAPPPSDAMHCALPISVECIKDWVDAAGDGRWCEIAKSILGIDLVKCPIIWETIVSGGVLL